MNWRFCGKILYILKIVVLIFICNNVFDCFNCFHTEVLRILEYIKKFRDTEMNSFKHYVEPALLHRVFYCLSNHFQTVQKRQTCMNNLTPCLYFCQAHKKQ